MFNSKFMTNEVLQKIEIAVAHHEQQLQDMSEMIRAQWQQIDALKHQLAMTHDKLKTIEASASEIAGDSNLSVAEIAARDKPPHY